MRNLLSKALLAIALDKKARQALEESRKAAPKPAAKPAARPAAKPAPAAPPEKENALSVTERLDQADKSARRELIRNAIRVRKAKMAVLDELSDEQRRELQIAALRAIIERSKAGRGGS